MGKPTRNKNKHELNPKSGARKKLPEKKTVIKFLFEDMQGVKFRNGTGRLKIDKEGCISFLILTENNDWKGIKGKLISLKVTQVAKAPKKAIKRRA